MRVVGKYAFPWKMVDQPAEVREFAGKYLREFVGIKFDPLSRSFVQQQFETAITAMVQPVEVRPLIAESRVTGPAGAQGRAGGDCTRPGNESNAARPAACRGLGGTRAGQYGQNGIFRSQQWTRLLAASSIRQQSP